VFVFAIGTKCMASSSFIFGFVMANKCMASSSFILVA
jgi:hypothetical protein